jgi:hypothetical protein
VPKGVARGRLCDPGRLHRGIHAPLDALGVDDRLPGERAPYVAETRHFAGCICRRTAANCPRLIVVRRAE